MPGTLPSIRNSILGADRPLRVIPGGRGGPPSGGVPAEDEPRCPITPLGHADGVCYVLDVAGQRRALTARQMANRHELRGLFGGDEEWLRDKFPEVEIVKGEGGEKKVNVIGFSLNLAVAWLQKACAEQGLFGDHIQFRRAGIWRGEGGLPVVHCGDFVLIENQWHEAGIRTGQQVWVASPPVARPGTACDHSVGQELQAEIQRLWDFKQAGGAGLLLGLIATAMLGLSARWRPNAFLCGEGGSGKSMLLDVLRAVCPLHLYSNDASPAGVSARMNGSVMPIFIDEASDRDQQAAEALLELVLSSSTGDGTRGVRALADGKFRTIEMAGCMLYASVSPPTMQPAVLSRITLVELRKPNGGEDHQAEHQALAEWAAKHGPALWARVIAAAERWAACLTMCRTALSGRYCAPREADQFGALLAGWWVLTREGLPDEAGVAEAIGLASEFVQPSDVVAEESSPRRAIRHLLAHTVQYDGTTRTEQIGTLLRRYFAVSENGDPDHRSSALAALEKHGLRPILPCLRLYEFLDPGDVRRDAPEPRRGWWAREEPEMLAPDALCYCPSCRDRQGRRVPRLGDRGGVWLLPVAVGPLFRGVRGLEGDRWRMELLREICRPSAAPLRVGGVTGRALWLPRDEIDDGGWPRGG